MNKFLERHKLQNFSRKIDNQNCLLSIIGTEFLVKQKQTATKKTPDSDGISGEFYQICKEEILILNNLFQ